MDMMFPVRCFSCGKVIGQYWEEYNERLKKGEDPLKIMEDLGIDRYCCRRMFLEFVEYIDEIAKTPRSRTR